MHEERRPLVVVAGDAPWHGHRLAAQHIAQRLTRYADVLYVEQPRSPIGRRRAGAGPSLAPPRAHPVDGVPGLFVLAPLVNPGKTRPGGRRLAEWLTRRQARRAAARLAPSVHATIQIPVHHLLLGAFDEPIRVHLASDDFVAAAAQNGVAPGWVRRAERRVARRTTQVIAVNRALANRWRGIGFEPVLVPNGCDADLYADLDQIPPVAVPLSRPIAGFIGTLSDRTDASLLSALAARGHSLLLVGPRSPSAPNPALDAVLAAANVHWTGPQPYTDVPAFLAQMDVGLVPYRMDDFNRASLPLKALDYLAGGRAVVSTPIPALADLHSEDIHLAADRDAFVAAAERLLAEPGLAADRARRIALARASSWDARVAELARAIDLPISGPPDRTPAPRAR